MVTDESLCLLTAMSSIKEQELTTWWGEWAHVIQNLGRERKGKHEEENYGQVLYFALRCTDLQKTD